MEQTIHTTAYFHTKYMHKLCYLTLLLCLLPVGRLSCSTVYIKPFDAHHFVSRSQFFDMRNPYAGFVCRRSVQMLVDRLESLGHTVQIVQKQPILTEHDIFLCFDKTKMSTAKLANNKKDNRILFLWEPEHVIHENYSKTLHDYFSTIFTWDDELVDGKKYKKLYWPQPCLSIQSPLIPFGDRKLCSMINAHKNFQHQHALYPERRRIVDFFERYAPQDFDLWGASWPSTLRTYRGCIPVKQPNHTMPLKLAIAHQAKIECLQRYKFSICYENLAGKYGYITEKIFDCFAAGCVPIYKGAENIGDYIPTDCFIDGRRFKKPYELYRYIQTIDEKCFNHYIQNIRNFLRSDQARLFSTNHFINTVISAITQQNQQ